MKVTVLIPDIEDKKVKDCLNEIIRQTNAALSGIDKKFEELRREINGEHKS